MWQKSTWCTWCIYFVISICYCQILEDHKLIWCQLIAKRLRETKTIVMGHFSKCSSRCQSGTIFTVTDHHFGFVVASHCCKLFVMGAQRIRYMIQLIHRMNTVRYALFELNVNRPLYLFYDGKGKDFVHFRAKNSISKKRVKWRTMHILLASAFAFHANWIAITFFIRF